MKRVISWELISTNPEVKFTSHMTTIKLLRVTEDNRTFLGWESDFSNDVNAHIVLDGKYKKLEYFKALRNLK